MAVPRLDAMTSRDLGHGLVEVLAPIFIRVATGIELLVRQAAPVLFGVAQAIEQIEKLPPVERYEALLIQKGHHPLEARFIARVIIKLGEDLHQECLAEQSLASAIRPLAKTQNASPLVVSRRAKVLERVLKDPVVEAPLRKACALVSVSESIDSLKELVGRGLDRDAAACWRLTEISRELRPHLRDPRGRVPTVASTTHEILLHWHKGAFTYDPNFEDMTDGATLATRIAMNAPDFDPRPARRRQRARQIQ